MPTNYNTFVGQFFNAVAASTVATYDGGWLTELPLVIDRAEGRLYRELELLDEIITDTTGSLTAGQQAWPLPTAYGTFLVLHSVNVVTPASVTLASSTATRIPLTGTTRAMIDNIYPSGSVVGPPEYYARPNANTLYLGPTPDSSYGMEIVGLQQPTALSSNNPTTPLTNLFPDLWFAAAMTEAVCFMRDTGGMSDNPAMSAGWEATYQKLLMSAHKIEQQRKMRSEAWGSADPSKLATPPRR